jgi:hypothetical protein
MSSNFGDDVTGCIPAARAGCGSTGPARRSPDTLTQLGNDA